MSKEVNKITADNQIKAFLHCAKCLKEWNMTLGVSPREFAKIEFGWTPYGIQAWCFRHNLNIMNIDFEGMKHNAITYAKENKQ